MAILPRSTYYDKHYRQAPALIRARRPFLVKNILTGMSIFGFAVGVCTYSPVARNCHRFPAKGQLHLPVDIVRVLILAMVHLDAFTIRAVAQDDFEDVPLPDAPVQMAGPPNASTVRSAGPATK
ncbi:MAG: hypothetical protein M1819_005003 [Sarea resinae]|nr:MAG: hypothetical protein M1819_005003 [Sarea resinae]